MKITPMLNDKYTTILIQTTANGYIITPLKDPGEIDAEPLRQFVTRDEYGCSMADVLNVLLAEPPDPVK